MTLLEYVNKLMEELVKLRKQAPSILVAKEQAAALQEIPDFLSSVATNRTKEEALAAKRERFARLTRDANHKTATRKIAKIPPKKTFIKKGGLVNVRKSKGK